MMRPASERCDQNYAAAFEALMPHVGSNLGERRAFGSVVAVATGIDLAFYNPVFATTDDAGTENVVAAVTWMRSLGLPASVQLAEGLRARLEPRFSG